MSSKIYFATTNSYKFKLATKELAELIAGGMEIVQFDEDTPEIQSDSLEDIAKFSAQWVMQKTGYATIASDVGFFIEALNGFPGPFVKYVNGCLNPMQILMLLKKENNRKAHFTDAIAYMGVDGTPVSFSSQTTGRITGVESVKPTQWPMDALFIPDGHDKTLAEMDDAERDGVWNNGRWKKLVEYLKNNPA